MSNPLLSIRPATLRKVVAYIEQELDLSIYGPCMNPETGAIFASNMDFDIEDILKLRTFLAKGGVLKDFGEEE